VLHYVENNKLLNDTLVLIDAGCEVEGYAADITRSFPVNGRFNAAQKDVTKSSSPRRPRPSPRPPPAAISWKRTTPPCAC
jgi:hypothetical protein